MTNLLLSLQLAMVSWQIPAASFGNASSLQQKQPPTALTLRQWMIMKRSNLDGNNNAIMSLDGGSRSSSHSSPLPDLHLIPPAIIAMENILIRFKDNATMIGQPKSMVSWKTKAVLIMYPSRHIWIWGVTQFTLVWPGLYILRVILRGRTSLVV